MILDITSFGWSGSGAYHDLMREFDNMELACEGDWEFSLLWDVDGIYDLDHKLCHKCCRIYDSDMAFQRFLHRVKIISKEPMMGYTKIFPNDQFYELCKEYIDKLVKIRFTANSFNDVIYYSHKFNGLIQNYNKLTRLLFGNRLVRKIFGTTLLEGLLYYKTHEMLVAYKPNDFMNITQDFIQKIIDRARNDRNKIFVSDQMLPPDNQDLFLKYFKESLKTIIVRRDPRDTFIAMHESGRFPYPIPLDIDDFIWFYKTIVIDSKKPDTENSISLNFEDLIYNYEETIAKISKLVNLGKHVYQNKYFNPEISKNNTQLFRLFTKYSHEIGKIEKELPDALYNFDKFEFKRSSSIIF